MLQVMVKHRTLFVIFSILTITGCAQPADFKMRAEVMNIEASDVFVGAVSLPSEFLTADSEERVLIDAAVTLATSMCMADQGYALPIVMPQVSLLRSPYGPVDPDLAALEGYRGAAITGAALTAERDSAANELQALHAALTAPDELQGRTGDESKFDDALFGTEDGVEPLYAEDGATILEYNPVSCQVSGLERIMPNWRGFVTIQPRLDQLGSAAVDASIGDPEVVDAWDRWSQCMAARGLTFANPDAALFSVWSASGPDSNELNTAQADAECKQEDDVLWDWSSVAARIANDMLAEIDGFEQWRAEWPATTERAESYIDTMEGQAG